MQAGDLTGAEAAFNQLLNDYPSSPKAPGAQLRLADIQFARTPGATQSLLDAYSLVRTKFPSTPESGEALVHIGFLHCRGTTDQAIDDFSTFLTSYPGHALAAKAQQTLGSLYMRTRDLDRAEQAFDKVKTIEGAPAQLVEQANLQSGFVKIMKFYTSRKRTDLEAAITAMMPLSASEQPNVRVKADLGIAEATLMLGRATEARAKYVAAAQAHTASRYFKGIALYGVACASRHQGKMVQAATDFNAFLAAQPEATLAEKDSGWKQAAFQTLTPVAQAKVQSTGDWSGVQGSQLVVDSVYQRARSLYQSGQYDQPIAELEQLIAYLPASQLKTDAVRLRTACIARKGGG